MAESEHFYCNECGEGFYDDTYDEVEPECPFCGSTDVQP